MITGINHITLSVQALDKSLAFYVEILGCQLKARWQHGAYLLAGDLWLCLAWDQQTRTSPLPEYSHIAFHVHKNNFDALSKQIKNSGAIIWKQNSSEGDSLYFLDLDRHKLEIHSGTFQDRIAACRQSPYSGMIFF